MKLTAREILKLLGFDIPEDGVSINPEDAHYHQVMLELLGTTISPAAINEAAFAQVSHANANDQDRAITRTQYATVMKNVYGFSHANSSEHRPAHMAMIDSDKLKPLSDEVMSARTVWIDAAEALDSLLLATQAKDGAGDYTEAVKLAAERSKSARADYNDLARRLANQVHTLILHAEL